jgi:hypothetical protein
MAKKSTLQLRKLPPDLLGRVNAYIELLGVDREDFFREMLDDLTKELKPVQDKLRKAHEAKKLKKANSDQQHGIRTVPSFPRKAAGPRGIP